MPSYIVKTAPDRDEYVYWSDIVEAPHIIGTRAEVGGYIEDIGETGSDLDGRFRRADETGTSAMPGFYAWDHGSLIVQQRGVLPRARLSEFCHLYMVDDGDDAPCWALLEPFEDADLDGWLARYHQRAKGSS